MNLHEVHVFNHFGLPSNDLTVKLSVTVEIKPWLHYLRCLLVFLIRRSTGFYF